MRVKKQALNYDSPQSQETIKRIIAFLLGRPIHGATQQHVADMLEVSLQTANRFIQHLLLKNEIHEHIKAQAMGRNSPAYYLAGPPVVTHFPKRGYSDLPLNFFGGVERRKTKRTINMDMIEERNHVANTEQQARDKMTDWFDVNSHQPPCAGPWQCKIISGMMAAKPDEEPVTHMRWFDGVRWSWPLQPEHMREDGYKKPDESQFLPEGLPTNIAWRGYTEDQEPL
jgi:hypothetical protein